MSIGAWIAIAVAVAWWLCALVAWRPIYRHESLNMNPGTWGAVFMEAVWATFVALSFGPFLVAGRAFTTLVGSKYDAVEFSRRLAGEPSGQRLRRRLRDLEARNAELERELGL